MGTIPSLTKTHTHTTLKHTLQTAERKSRRLLSGPALNTHLNTESWFLFDAALRTVKKGCDGQVLCPGNVCG